MRHRSKTLLAASLLLLAALRAAAAPAPRAGHAAVQPGDYIVAVVNTESITATELKSRMDKMRAEPPPGAKPFTEAELRRQALELLIEERAMVTYARDNGVKVDDAEVDHAVANIAASNKLTLAELRQQLAAQGLDYRRFRENLRDQIIVERIREREVVGRIKISEGEIADYLERQHAQRLASDEVDIAQILVSVPEGASETVRAERQARAELALARLRRGESFEHVALEFSDDANRARGGEMGTRPIAGYPDLFAGAVRDLKVGEVAPRLVVSGAGFHILKLLSRGEDAGVMVTQTHARHILLRPSPQLSQAAAMRRLGEFRQAIVDRKRRFEDLAREFSEDGSAAQGGDLGWSSPGNFVPEFESTMDKLPAGGVSQPFVSRFGVHLLQVLERREVRLDPREVREQARNAIREQKFEGAYNDWVADLRARAFVEIREAPQP